MITLASRQLTALLALASLPALLSGFIQLRWNAPAISMQGEVTLATIETWDKRVLWVDARGRAKFDREHIPGAVLLNEEEWEKAVPDFLDAWAPEKQIVIYGDSDGGEGEVARRLRAELKL